MLRSALRIGGLVLALATLPRPAFAVPVTVDFESLSDLEVLTNQLPGLTFSGATALVDGESLDSFSFPPRSGQRVVYDESAPITISFASVVYSLSGYFTYTAQLTLTAFDAVGAFLGSITSAFADNTALAGTPNELLQFSSLDGIGSVTIAGGEFGNSFTLDDLTYDNEPGQPPTHSVPEPGTLALLLLGAGLVVRHSTFDVRRARNAAHRTSHVARRTQNVER